MPKVNYISLPQGQYYKLARPDGYDFYTGKTVNYRENIGKTVKVPQTNYKDKSVLCTASVLHASKNPNDCFIGSSIPCSMYIVKGTPTVRATKKNGFKKLFIIEEIPETQMDKRFGFKYSEAKNPVHPFKINPPKINKKYINLVHIWGSVWDYVLDSVWSSVWDSVHDSVWDSVHDSVWDYVLDSIQDSILDSILNSVLNSVLNSILDYVWSSVRGSIWAYIGSLFININKWKNVKHKHGEYPFQSCVDLWMVGLIPSFDGIKWRLHGGPKGEVLWIS